MRHQVGHRKLHRTTSHRLAMLKNMVSSLLEHEAIRTTLPKAKEARRVAERIITLGKRGGLANVRLAARTVANRSVLEKVFTDLRARYAKRAGGYTRIIRLGYRPGDAAPMALVELVDRPEAPEKASAEKPVSKAATKSAEAKPAPKAEGATAAKKGAATRKPSKAKAVEAAAVPAKPAKKGPAASEEAGKKTAKKAGGESAKEKAKK